MFLKTVGEINETTTKTIKNVYIKMSIRMFIIYPA